MDNSPAAFNVINRAKNSLGLSQEPIYAKVLYLIELYGQKAQTVVDIGCGTGKMLGLMDRRFTKRIGVDIVRHENLRQDIDFHLANLDSEKIPLDDALADIVLCVEVIEHVENPRALMRELARLCKPGGLIIVTTPNQLSVLSKLTFLVKNCFNAFQDQDYPAHITALLEIDLIRIAKECRLNVLAIKHSESGRMLFTARHFPAFLSKIFPRAFSDNVILVAAKTS